MREIEDSTFQLIWVLETLRDILENSVDTVWGAEIFYEQITPLQILQKMVEPDQEASRGIGEANHIQDSE